MLTAIVLIKVRTLRSKQRFEHYAEQLQENRKLIRAESLERKRAETNNDESLVKKKQITKKNGHANPILPTSSAPAVPPPIPKDLTFIPPRTTKRKRANAQAANISI
jgi:hypothetical protein